MAIRGNKSYQGLQAKTKCLHIFTYTSDRGPVLTPGAIAAYLDETARPITGQAICVPAGVYMEAKRQHYIIAYPGMYIQISRLVVLVTMLR